MRNPGVIVSDLVTALLNARPQDTLNKEGKEAAVNDATMAIYRSHISQALNTALSETALQNCTFLIDGDGVQLKKGDYITYQCKAAPEGSLVVIKPQSTTQKIQNACSRIRSVLTKNSPPEEELNQIYLCSQVATNAFEKLCEGIRNVELTLNGCHMKYNPQYNTSNQHFSRHVRVSYYGKEASKILSAIMLDICFVTTTCLFFAPYLITPYFPASDADIIIGNCTQIFKVFCPLIFCSSVAFYLLDQIRGNFSIAWQRQITDIAGQEQNELTTEVRSLIQELAVFIDAASLAKQCKNYLDNNAPPSASNPLGQSH